MYPSAVALDTAGNLYIADLGYPDEVRMVSPGGVISRVAGGGSYGFADGVPALNTSLYPQGIYIDSSNNLFISDLYNYRIRKVALGSASTTAADSSLAVSPASQTLVPGASAAYTATITALNGFNSAVTLSCSGLPSGATCNFNPNPAGAGAATL